MTTKKIDSFSGENRFLSNFWPVEITYNGRTYPSVEHAYQAQKTTDEEIREKISKLEKPGQAKEFGQGLGATTRIRLDWTNEMRILIMTELIELKFSEKNPDLVSRLLRTEDAELIEGNDWGDVFFGVCGGEGKNHLGNILMATREKIKRENEYIKNQQAYVKVVDGKTVLIDPVAYAIMKAINKSNCESTYLNNLERIQHFKNRIEEKKVNPEGYAIVIINVDAPYGGEIAESLMPGHDWQQYRDQGQTPMARGLVHKKPMTEIINLFDNEASLKINTITGVPVVVVDHGVAEIFSV